MTRCKSADRLQAMESIHARNANLPVVCAYGVTTSGFEILSAPPTKFHPLSTASMTFSLTWTKNGIFRMSKVREPVLLKPSTKTDMRIGSVEFVDENEAVVSAYGAEESDTSSPLVNVAPSSGDRHSVGNRLPPDQRVAIHASPNCENHNNIDQTEIANFEEPLKSAVLPESSLDERDEMQQMPSTHPERKRRERSPELKFTTFQKSANFDTFRPLPRSHFSSDAMSVWPLRSIEESRLLMHFVQNLGPWVRVRSEITGISPC